MKISYNVNKNGFYGDFGGAFVPEMMHANIAELKSNYIKISSDESYLSPWGELGPAEEGSKLSYHSSIL